MKRLPSNLPKPPPKVPGLYNWNSFVPLLGRRRGAGVPMSEGEIVIRTDGNTVAWYVFDDLDTITKNAATNEVSLWKDRLDSGRDLVQSTPTQYPIWNATSGITFDGINDSLKAAPFTLNQPVFIYAIIKQITWTDGDRIWNGNTNDVISLLQSTSTPRIALWAGAALNNDNAAVGSWVVLRCLYNGANSSFQVDATAKVTGDAGAGNPGGFTLGKIAVATNYWSNVAVSEIVIRKTADSSEDETSIYNYLAARKLLL